VPAAFLLVSVCFPPFVQKERGGYECSISAIFYNMATASYTTRQMYVSDRTAGMWRRNSRTGEILGWTEGSLSLAEV